jgi:hypothetical protein
VVTVSVAVEKSVLPVTRPSPGKCLRETADPGLVHTGEEGDPVTADRGGIMAVLTL